MPEPDVKITEVEPLVSDPSSEPNSIPQAGDSPAGEPVVEPGAVTPKEPVVKEPEDPTSDDQGVSYFNRTKELERRLDKAHKEITELQTKPSTSADRKEITDKYFQNMADDIGIEVDTLKKLDTFYTNRARVMVDEATKDIREVSIRSLYEKGAISLKQDVVNYPDYEELKPTMDKMINELLQEKVYQNPAEWRNPNLLKEIAIRARGTLALGWRSELLKKGIKLGQQNRKIVGEAGIEGGHKPGEGGNYAITAEVKELAKRADMSLEEASRLIKIKQDREKIENKK